MNFTNVILVLVRLLKHLTRMKILWRDYLTYVFLDPGAKVIKSAESDDVLEIKGS